MWGTNMERVKRKKPKTLGQRIRLVRGDLTQKQFAAMLQTKQANISNFELDKRAPHTRVLVKISSVSQRSMEWLLTGEEAPPSSLQHSDLPTREELFQAASACLLETGVPEAQEFIGLLKFFLADRKARRKILKHYLYLKSHF